MQFANPWGLLALLGIPAVLFIHSLRRSPRTFLTNTLFLIEARLRDPGGGRKMRRLRRSAQLWLRLLLVVLLTWVLARPVTVREDSTQRIVLVVDESASMSASQETLAPALRAAAKPWLKQTAHTEWIVLSSVADAPPIHRGWDDFDRVIDRLEQLEPRRGNHDPHSALNLALGLASTHGRVLYVTDHLPEPALPGIGVLSIGTKVQNVGWCGVETSPDGSWRAILRNYGDSEQARTLSQADGSQLNIQLKPGEWRNLEGLIPAGAASAKLVLGVDNFALDDTLHLIRPRRKPLTWTSIAAPTSLEKLFLASDLQKAKLSADADVELRSNDLAPASAEHARLLIPTKPAPDASYVKMPATATSHPLTEGLIFDGLLWRECAPLNPAEPDDTVLLWSGSRPLAVLRDQDRTLELGFHPDLSNLRRVPSALVLVQRWLDTIRDAKVAPESLQLATGDRVQLAAAADGDTLELAWAGGSNELAATSRATINAPDSPGPMSIVQGELTLLEAAVNFVDPLESDFSKADAGFVAPPEPTSMVQRASLPDRFRDLWLLLALTTLLLSWTFPESSTKPKSKTQPA
ncbi:MAG: hypothetical protein ACI9UA_004685 [Pseudoalteromonas tetraodonis]|jgi:hypothetical protein